MDMYIYPQGTQENNIIFKSSTEIITSGDKYFNYKKINCQGPWQKNIILSINALPYWSGHYLLIKYVWPYLSLLPGNEVWDLFCQLPEFLKVDISIRKLIGTTLIQEIQVFYKQTKKWNDDLERKKKFIRSCLP